MRLTCSLFRGFALAHGRQRCEPCYVASLAGYPPYNYFSYKCYPPPLSLFLPPTPTLQRLAIKAHKRRCSLGSISILPPKSLQLPGTVWVILAKYMLWVKSPDTGKSGNARNVSSTFLFFSPFFAFGLFLPSLSPTPFFMMAKYETL